MVENVMIPGLRVECYADMYRLKPWAGGEIKLVNIRFVRVSRVAYHSYAIELAECEDFENPLVHIQWRHPRLPWTVNALPHYDMLTNGVDYCILYPWMMRCYEILHDIPQYNTPGIAELREWLSTM